MSPPSPTPAVLVVALCMLGCGKEQPARRQPPPGEPTGAVNIHQPWKLGAVESSRLDGRGEPLRVPCASCHSLREAGPLPSRPEELEEFHRGLTFRHGSLECASCHSPGQSESLHLATGKGVPMAEAMSLCAQCHGSQYKDYQAGVHGGMSGHWDLSRGERTRNHCVDCHDAHAPAYVGGRPVLPPRDRHLPPPPHEEASHHE